MSKSAFCTKAYREYNIREKDSEKIKWHEMKNRGDNNLP